MLASQMDTPSLIATLKIADLPVITPETDGAWFRASFLGYDEANKAGAEMRERVIEVWKEIRPYWREAVLRRLTMPAITEPVKTLIDRLAMEELCLKLI